MVTTSAGSTSWHVGDPFVAVDSGLTVTDSDSANLAGAQARISAGFEAGDDLQFVNQNGIAGAYNTGTGVLTLSGSSTVANYQAALRSVTFFRATAAGNGNTKKTVTFVANDGAVNSNIPTRFVQM